ncbi:MAG: cation:proton antiporter [Waddliaceae bacterium]|jgi:Kef-type K+ transport system membrane component KefB|nr:cation:proton antiporter [Waddliaceae bacterium]MBT3578629.1 cation:proton antiporter [Waddliaceae bacterium]MBT4445348.1 cation:proton antiporter [Waddliaceae bacterium]MBT6928384.1 cation:proton antiporter [Waddliaceae bacterium]MBT7265070.1 cation:proton antiporter [Waddliaceae bacterium]
MNDILALGLFFLLGYTSSRIMTFLKLPAIIGYIIVGLVLGPSVTNIVNAKIIEDLDFIGYTALGFIAFIIGGRIKISALRKLKEHIIFITVFQALATFILVFIGIYFISRSAPIAALLAAISAATAPAAVFAIIKELKAKGPLAKTLLAIVAIDDAICLALFGVVAAIVLAMMGNGSTECWHVILTSLVQLVGAIVIGMLIGFSINYIVNGNKKDSYHIYIAVSLVLLGCGVSIALNISPLLTNMVAGCFVANTFHASRKLFKAVENIEEIIIVLFFALAGARLQIALIPQVWHLVLMYVATRWCGKVFGGMLGARISKAPKVVQKYVGLGLVPQAGVAIGLIYIVKDIIPEISATITAIVLASIVFDEIIGPIGTEIALIKSKEGKRPTV